MSRLFYITFIGNFNQGNVPAAAVSNKTAPDPTTMKTTTRQALIPRPVSNINGGNQPATNKQFGKVERATSPVDERIINEFYTDHPRDVHQYQLEGRQYVVYEGIYLMNIDTYRKGK